MREIKKVENKILTTVLQQLFFMLLVVFTTHTALGGTYVTILLTSINAGIIGFMLASILLLLVAKIVYENTTIMCPLWYYVILNVIDNLVTITSLTFVVYNLYLLFAI